MERKILPPNGPGGNYNTTHVMFQTISDTVALMIGVRNAMRVSDEARCVCQTATVSVDQELTAGPGGDAVPRGTPLRNVP